eukprot:TRINITY_DN19925_c0_g1::TRINITY_DN19925_c0_g1_i1::g.28933::m.28933 TRINITY_DN19925_c0_g1::TRINITY_DN19925_c0_g1_i1::g.28933  ORF type:complete len:117 (-),score=6.58,Vitelline_membr/PF10542.4/0.098 TRINITY_DN19925_c0_g1_i1:61-411(-)
MFKKLSTRSEASSIKYSSETFRLFCSMPNFAPKPCSSFIVGDTIMERFHSWVRSSGAISLDARTKDSALRTYSIMALCTPFSMIPEKLVWHASMVILSGKALGSQPSWKCRSSCSW